MSVKLMKPLSIAESGTNSIPFSLVQPGYYLGSIKLDGIRGCVARSPVTLLNTSYSNSGKPLLSELIQSRSKHLPLGLDGEWIYGDPTHPLAYNRTQSVVNSKQLPEWANPAELRFFVFDRYTHKASADERYTHTTGVIYELTKNGGFEYLVSMTQTLLSPEQFDTFYQTCIDMGYEGAMFRRCQAYYKFGRTDKAGCQLLRMKPFGKELFEARIIDVFEQQTNLNEATTSELGLQVRSSHQDNKVGNGKLGGFICKMPDGRIFRLSSSSMTETEKRHWWEYRSQLLQYYARYKCLTYGAKELPRAPVFAGLRHKDDMTTY